MIGLYYTGANQFNLMQDEPSLSLGNYISSSKIPNRLLNNLFGSISGSILEKGIEEIRCIAIKNEGATPITSLTLSMKLEDVSSSFNAFLINPAEDDCDGFYFENLNTRLAIPTLGDLQPLDDENAIQVALDLQPGGYVGLWLQRVVEPVNQGLSSLECEDCNRLYEDFLQGKSVDKKEIYKLVFDYS